MKFYDEYQQSTGGVRLSYENALKIESSFSSSERERVFEKTRRTFHGDYAVDPIPRVLRQDEIYFLRGAVYCDRRAGILI